MDTILQHDVMFGFFLAIIAVWATWGRHATCFNAGPNIGL